MLQRRLQQINSHAVTELPSHPEARGSRAVAPRHHYKAGDRVLVLDCLALFAPDHGQCMAGLQHQNRGVQRLQMLMSTPTHVRPSRQPTTVCEAKHTREEAGMAVTLRNCQHLSGFSATDGVRSGSPPLAA